MKKIFALLLLLGVMAGAAYAAISDPVSSAITAGKYLYVPNYTSNQVLIYDASGTSATLKATINLVGTPKGLALSPDGGTLYIATTGNADLSAYNATTGAVIGAFSGITLNGPRQVAVSPDGARVYLVDSVANKVLVYNASSRAYITSINVGVSNLYGIAISPDNNMVAVTKRASSGTVYIYSMTRDSSYNITGYTLKTTLSTSSLVYPSFVAFSAQADRLFVRTHQTASPYADAVVYSGTNFGTSANIELLTTSEQDPNNQWGEGMSVSSNGQFIYLTHYRTTDSKVHLFRISTLNATGGYRTSWPAGSIDASLDGEMSAVIPPSIDGLCGVPDGSREWVTDSEDAYHAFSKWTGFTDGSGTLTNPVPYAPIIQHPASPDDMVSYTGSAQWTYASGDTHTYRRYEVSYSVLGSGSWTTLEGYTSNVTTSLASLTVGNTYIIRVRMFGAMSSDGTGGVWGPFAYSQPFSMANPTITSIKKGTTVISKGYIYDSIKIVGTGFGTRAIGSDPVDGTDYHINFSYYKSLGQYGMWVYEMVPSYEGTNQRITSWTNTEIDMVVPRKFKNGDLVLPRNDYNVYVTAFGISSNSKTLEVGPVITTMTPTSGVVGTTVDIYGAGFGSSQGSSTVTFYNGQTATASIWSSDTDSDHIRCTVPGAATTGAVKVTVNSEDTYANYCGTSTPVTFTVTIPPTPVITKFQLDTNPDPVLNNWVDTTEACVYDHIKIVGTGFGTDPGDGNRASSTNNVTIGGLKVRDDSGSTGMQVYAWSDTGIEIGIPRRVSSSFINSGANAVVVTANGTPSASMSLNIDPKLYSITPDNCYKNETPSVTIKGTALNGSRTVYFAGVDSGSGTISRETGDDPDGTNGTDDVTLTVLATVTATVGTKDVTSTVASRTSNAISFTVNATVVPVITKLQLKNGLSYVDTTEACIYDTIKIVGTGFGSDPGDGSRDSVSNNVTVGGVKIRDAIGSDGLQVYSWSNTAIELGIPRRRGTSFINAGSNEVVVTAGGVASGPTNLNINPHIYDIAPTSGVVNSTATVEGTALEGSRTVYFDATSAGSGSIIRQNGDDPDGTNGVDQVTVTVPGSLTLGTKEVTAQVNTRTSNYTNYTVTTLPVPTITKLQVKNGGVYSDTTEAIVYDTIKIVGSGFGSDPGDGSRDTGTNNVTLGGIRIRDASGSNGLQVYSWSDTGIEFGIPRRRGTNFVNAGANAVIVTASGVVSNSLNLNIKPHIYGITPDSGNPNITATVEGTALEGSRTVYFDATGAGSGTIARQNGDDPDGTNGNDRVAVTVPLGLTAGLKAVTANVNAFVSNNDVTFNVIPAGAPTITQIIPNVAPNTADITVAIKGTNFQSGATVVLKKAGQTDITGVVTFESATKLTVKFPITGKTVGKWNVVLTNPDTQTVTKSKGFTITDSSGEISEIIDDYEGVAVKYATGYTFFPSVSDITFATTEAEKYEGDAAGSATYPLSASSYRGFNGNLTTMQDISSFTTVMVYVKSSDASGSKIKVQLTDVSGKNFAAVDGTGTQKVSIPTANGSWTKYTLQLSDFVEVDSSGMPVVSGATLNKAGITNYQVIFTGAAASTAPVYVDFVAAGGYTPPTTGSSEITTTIVRAADTVGSAVTLSWVYNDGYVGNADIYTVSGSWDAVTGVFTSDATKWTKSFSNVTSPQTDLTQVGQGTQKYYKVVKTGTVLTTDMLTKDVAGKFDIAVGPSDTQPERALISIPLVTTSTALSSVFGTQPQENDAIAVVDNSFAITSGRIFTGGVWTDIPSTPSLTDMKQGYAFVYTTLASKYMTVVGKVLETSNVRTISGGTVSGEAALSWIGSSLPTPAPIADSKTGLNGLSAGPDGTSGAQSALIDANAAIIGNNYALHNGASTWVDSSMLPASMQLMPGRGYMLTEPTIPSYSWTQSR